MLMAVEDTTLLAFSVLFSFFYQKSLGGEGISPLGACLIRVCIFSPIINDRSYGAKNNIFDGSAHSSS
jgi:hypothetical protein